MRSTRCVKPNTTVNKARLHLRKKAVPRSKPDRRTKLIIPLVILIKNLKVDEMAPEDLFGLFSDEGVMKKLDAVNLKRLKAYLRRWSIEDWTV